MGIDEQMSIIMAEHPPCTFSAPLSISLSTVTWATTRPSNFSGSSVLDNIDISVSRNRDANSLSKPLKGLSLVDGERWLSRMKCRALSSVSFTSGEAFPSTWEVSISLPGIGGKGHWTGVTFGCEFVLLKQPKSRPERRVIAA